MTRGRFPARRVVVIMAAAVLLGLAGSGARPSTVPTELAVAPEILARLQTLANGLHNEIVLCLDGGLRGDTAFVDEFSMPTPRESTPMRSSFDPCPGGTLASWHNHPMSTRPRAASGLGPLERSPNRARRLCVLSGTDISTAQRLGYPFVVVSVDAQTWCWWTLAEVERFASRSISPGPPAPGRLASHDGLPSWSSPEGVAAGR